MNKKPVEHCNFESRIKQLDCVRETKVNKHEVCAEIYCENPNWGMPDKLEDELTKQTFGNEWCIVDFSHIEELENNGCLISLYMQPKTE